MGLTLGNDPSACCQLCVESENCAASADDLAAGNCFLYYTEPACGLAFSYGDYDKSEAPGQGFFVQTDAEQFSLLLIHKIARTQSSTTPLCLPGSKRRHLS